MGAGQSIQRAWAAEEELLASHAGLCSITNHILTSVEECFIHVSRDWSPGLVTTKGWVVWKPVSCIWLCHLLVLGFWVNHLILWTSISSLWNGNTRAVFTGQDCCWGQIDYMHIWMYFKILTWEKTSIYEIINMGQTSLFLLFSHVWLFVTLWTAALHAFLSITISQSCSNACPLSQWHHPTISSSVVPFSSHFQSFPATGLFKWVSSLHQVAKVLEFQLQHQSFQLVFRTDWFPLGWTGWISLQPKGLSRVFSNTTVQKHQFFCTQLSL